jgi:uncharacterized protein
MSRLNPSPLRIDIARLGRRPGTMTTMRSTVPCPSRIGLELEAIEPGAPMDIDLRMESVTEGVLITGVVSAPTTGECARCLSAFTGTVTIHLTELFAFPGSLTEATSAEDEVGHVVDDRIDIEQAIVDAVGLELPLSPRCRPDCPGLCPHCGIPLASAGPSHRHGVVDHRWAKLAQLMPEQPEDDA